MPRSLMSFVALAVAACSVPATTETRSPPAPLGAPAAAVGQSAGDPGRVGVLVMAHGGSPEWDASVSAAVEPIANEVPTAVAYGMADPYTLSAALDSLEAENVDRVAVVRMFLSGESFLEQTRFFLGMSETPPATFVLMGPAAADPSARLPLDHDMDVATHRHGILASPEAGDVMVDRARALSVRPRAEALLLLAHGMGDEAENRRVLEQMERIGARVSSAGFAEVRSATLREDWPEARARSEADIREWVAARAAEGRRVLVLPMRLSGFGPYAEVLEGLPYLPGEGLLPHEAIGRWVRDTANRVSCREGWGPAAGSCPVVAAPAPRPPTR